MREGALKRSERNMGEERGLRITALFASIALIIILPVELARAP